MYPPDDARLFLDALTGEDNPQVTFQTFDDTDAKRGMLAGHLHGRLSDHAELLARLNALGATIAVMVNAGDLRGRSAANVRAIRALFIDDDGTRKRAYELAPSIVVRSKRGEHAYWLLRPGVLFKDFPVAQLHLARFYRTDAQVSDPARVMRLPGFWHRKADPFLITLLHADGSIRYGLDELLAAHP